jgi:glycosyltransferase involved in cell wall biosynthesis
MIAAAAGEALGQVGVDVVAIGVVDPAPAATAVGVAAIADPRLRIVRRSERGRLAAARNSGIEAARGEWVAFLDDDDLWSPDKLRLQLAAAEVAGAGLAYAGAVTVGAGREPLHRWRLPAPDRLLDELLALNVMPAGASNVVARTALVRELGGFDAELSHTTDWDMWIRLAAASPAAAVADPLVAYRLHDGQESRRGDEMLAELAIIDANHRALRAERGDVLDRPGFESFAARRGAATATAEPPARERLRRRVRGLLGVDRATEITPPDWLAARGGS